MFGFVSAAPALHGSAAAAAAASSTSEAARCTGSSFVASGRADIGVFGRRRRSPHRPASVLRRVSVASPATRPLGVRLPGGGSGGGGGERALSIKASSASSSSGGGDGGVAQQAPQTARISVPSTAGALGAADQQQQRQSTTVLTASSTVATASAPAAGKLWGTPLGGLLGVGLGAIAALVAAMQKRAKQQQQQASSSGAARDADDATPTTVLKSAAADGSSAAASSSSANGAGAGENLLDKVKVPKPPVNELRKVIPLGIIFFMILFNYTILRDTKDVLVVTAAGAEIIPFLKTYVNLPGAIAFTVLYSKLTNMFSREKVFYLCITPFVLFFLSYAWFMYPNMSVLHPTGFVSWALTKLPQSLAPPLAIIGNWTSAVFYTLAELWGSVVVSLLFWGFANEVTTVDEAKKWYPLFGLMANVALIFSGQYVRFVSGVRANLPPGVDGWMVSLRYLMGAVAAGGAVIIGTFYYMQRKVMSDPSLVDPNKQKKAKTKTKLGFRESVGYLARSSYIRNLALLVIAYGMSINIVEVSWKAKLRQQFPDPNSYSSFMGWFSSATGAFTISMMLLGRFIFRKFGWGAAAMVTPITLGITGSIFFGLTLFAKQLSPLVAALGATPLFLAVLVGAAQNVMSKGSKYALFDPCKEMAYIPLDAEQKSKGKAAIDVIGNPLGKSGGSFIQQALIFATGSLAASTPYFAVILGGIIFVWLAAARSLDKQFATAMSKEVGEAVGKAKEDLLEKRRAVEGAAAGSAATDGAGAPASAEAAERRGDACPQCLGSGRVYLLASNVVEGKLEARYDEKQCAVCGGSGKMVMGASSASA